MRYFNGGAWGIRTPDLLIAKAIACLLYFIVFSNIVIFMRFFECCALSILLYFSAPFSSFRKIWRTNGAPVRTKMHKKKPPLSAVSQCLCCLISSVLVCASSLYLAWMILH